MKYKCITCGKDLTDVVCEGKIGDMKVKFCDEHSKYCDNCDTVVCNTTKPDKEK
ncbi:MAG: hypothetical protein ABIH52_03100 [Candidatus Aenigmatarchaeota archaeon]|nr:hypothetical protein [Nanoarchaeota archaeon]